MTTDERVSASCGIAGDRAGGVVRGRAGEGLATAGGLGNCEDLGDCEGGETVGRRILDKPRRYALAGTGVMCVGLGALGVVTPGLPTTIFLIIASYCFSRSCPWLEDRLIRVPFFGPYLRYMGGGAVMPTKARWIASAMLWVGLGSSVLLLEWMDRTPGWLIPVIVAAGVVGTVCIWLMARGKKKNKGGVAETSAVSSGAASSAGAGDMSVAGAAPMAEPVRVSAATVLVEPKPGRGVSSEEIGGRGEARRVARARNTANVRARA